MLGASVWLVAAGHRGPPPAGDYAPKPHHEWLTPADRGEQVRLDALRRAVFRLPAQWAIPDLALPAGDDDNPLVCRFVNEIPTGTTPKFDCVLDGGEVVKIKYGRNPEIYAEAAATTLLTTLGYGADTVTIVPRVRCYGCPRFPFATMRLLSLVAATSLLPPQGYENSYTDFTNVALEKKFPAPAIETAMHKGWDWQELDGNTTSLAEVDALRLLAVFLAHWDNKAENQRLVCLDRTRKALHETCDMPLAFVQDLGSTFGPIKVNLTTWRELRIWSDASKCTVSMKTLPFSGATFRDRTISEEGRAALARQLATLTNDQVRDIFRQARFHEYYSGTDDERDLSEWTEAFREKVDQIVGASCSTSSIS